MANLDHVTPYLTTIFGFIGITDVKFIHIEPTAFYGEEAKEKAIEESKKKIEVFIAELTA